VLRQHAARERSDRAREDYQERVRAANRAQQEEFRRQMELQSKVAVARMRARELQQVMDESPGMQYALIVAVDFHGGFAKDGKIPWHFPDDLTWFKQRTKNQICVMGRATYETINEQLGDKAKESVLPDRRCFVVSNTLTDISNATIIQRIGEVTTHLSDEELDEKTIFFIGGERIYQESIALADTVYITVVEDVHNCDKFFPTDYMLEHFSVDKTFKHKNAPTCRFTIWKRNKETP